LLLFNRIHVLFNICHVVTVQYVIFLKTTTATTTTTTTTAVHIRFGLVLYSRNFIITFEQLSLQTTASSSYLFYWCRCFCSNGELISTTITSQIFIA